MPGTRCISGLMAPRMHSISIKLLICLFRAFGLCVIYLFPHLYNTFLLVFPLQSHCKSISVLPQHQCCPFNHDSPKSYFHSPYKARKDRIKAYRIKDCFAICVQDRRLKWSSILWISRITLQKTLELGWFAPMRICAVSFVYLQNVHCTSN